MVSLNTFSQENIFFLDKYNSISATKDPKKTINLKVNQNLLNEIKNKKSNEINLKLPFFNENIDLKLVKFNVYNNTLNITSKFEDKEVKTTVQPNIITYELFYNDKSVGVLNIFNNTINATFTINGIQYEINKHKENYYLFEVSNSINPFTFSCEVNQQFQSNEINII